VIINLGVLFKTRRSTDMSFRIMLLLCITILVSGISCTPCENGYEKVYRNKGIVKYSFEYPCDWKSNVRGIDYEVDVFPNTYIRIDAPWVKIEDKRKPSSHIGIDSRWPDEEIPDAKAWLLDDVSLWGSFPEFKILDESQFMLDDIEGKQIKYSYRTGFMDFSEGSDARGNDPMVASEMYFEYGGLIWNIRFSSNDATYNSHEPYFDHFLSTFKFHD